jgi:hypothetical protein
VFSLDHSSCTGLLIHILRSNRPRVRTDDAEPAVPVHPFDQPCFAAFRTQHSDLQAVKDQADGAAPALGRADAAHPNPVRATKAVALSGQTDLSWPPSTPATRRQLGRKSGPIPKALSRTASFIGCSLHRPGDLRFSAVLAACGDRRRAPRPQQVRPPEGADSADRAQGRVHPRPSTWPAAARNEPLEQVVADPLLQRVARGRSADTVSLMRPPLGVIACRAKRVTTSAVRIGGVPARRERAPRLIPRRRRFV